MATTQQIDLPQIQIINRVKNIPLVKSAIDYASGQYERIKGYNKLVNSTLMCAENSINYVASTAKPVAMSFERPLALADTLACHGLDKLEATVPVLKQSPEELYNNSLAKYEEIKKFGNTKVQVLKDFGYQKMNRALSNQYAQAFIKTVDSAVELTDNAVDHYLPANDDEKMVTAEQKGQLNVVQKMGSLSEKMRQRLMKQAVKHLHGLQKRSQEALQQMRYTVDLIQYTKQVEAAGRKQLANRLDFVQNQAHKLWYELNREENAEELNSKKTVEQQLLSIARRTTRRVIESYNNFKSVTNLLPENIRQSLDLSTNYARNVYKEFSYVKNVRDLSEVTLHQMSAGIGVMQTIMASLLSPLVSSAQKMLNKQTNSEANYPNANSTAWALPFLDLSNTSTFSNPSNIFNTSQNSNISNVSDDGDTPNTKPLNN